MHWGDLLMQEPGNMVGPTIQGIEALIAQRSQRALGRRNEPGC